MEIEFTSDLSAELVDYHGTDETIIKAARVSTQTELKEGDEKLLAFLMKNKHASPWEHCSITFLVDAPIFVAREHMRHRVQHFNEVSGRYSILKPRFYVPNANRPLIQVGKPGKYSFEKGSILDYQTTLVCLQAAYEEAWRQYDCMISMGLAKEIARMALPVAIYSAWYATASLRGWINFLALRTEQSALWEIQQIANQIETELTKLYPWTMKFWNEFGRGAL